MDADRNASSSHTKLPAPSCRARTRKGLQRVVQFIILCDKVPSARIALVYGPCKFDENFNLSMD